LSIKSFSVKKFYDELAYKHNLFQWNFSTLSEKKSNILKKNLKVFELLHKS